MSKVHSNLSGTLTRVIPDIGDDVLPNAAGAINLAGGNNVTVTGVAATETLTIDVTDTTEHAVQIGNASGSLDSLAIGTNGQVLLGASAADPAFATLSSANGTIVYVLGASTLDLVVGPDIARNFLADDANVATPTLGVLDVNGTGGLTTTAAADVLTITTDGTLATSYLTDDANSAIPAAGVLTIAGGANIGTTSAGSTVTLAVNGTTDHTLQVGNATGSLTSIAAMTNGQLAIGSTGADPVPATLTAGTGVTISNAAGAITVNAAGVDESNIIYVGKHGNDGNDGLTIQKAKLTFGAAITAAFAIAPAVVVCFDEGTYTENLTGQVDVHIHAPNCNIAGAHTIIAGNKWDFGSATIATATVGFTFNSAGGSAKLIIGRITVEGAGIGIACIAGDLYLRTYRVSLATGFLVGSATAGKIFIRVDVIHMTGAATVVGVIAGGSIDILCNHVHDESDSGTLVYSVAAGACKASFTVTSIDIQVLTNITAVTEVHILASRTDGALLESGAGSAETIISDIGIFGTEALGTNKTAADTTLLQAFDTAGATYTTFGTLTAGNPPTFDLADTVTINSSYIYRAGGTDVSVADGGTGVSTFTDGGVLVGAGAGAIEALAEGATGEGLVGNTGANPSWTGSPSYSGTVTIPNTNAAGTKGLIFLGTTEFISNYGTNSTFIGGAGNRTLTGISNTGIGSLSLEDLTTGTRNVAVGRYSGVDITEGVGNTIIGTLTGSAITTGSSNTAVGDSALSGVTITDDNVAIGISSLYNATGSTNTSCGSYSLQTCLGDENTALGAFSGSLILDGSYNTLIGKDAGLEYITTESSNICLGSKGVATDSNIIRIGTQGSGNAEQDACYIAGIYGVTPGGTLNMATVDSNGQFGSQAIPSGGGGGLSWSAITVDQTIAVLNGYICNKVGLLSLALPTTSAVGDVFRVTGMNTDLGWTITQAASQQIHFGSASTTTGVGGSISSVLKRDTIECVCVVANLEWNVTSSISNLTIV